MASRKELMNTLNQLLGTDYNWKRINHLDLERLTNSIKNKKPEPPKVIRQRIISGLDSSPLDIITKAKINAYIIPIINNAFDDHTCVICGKSLEDHKMPCMRKEE